jgi:hypothetical protein
LKKIIQLLLDWPNIFQNNQFLSDKKCIKQKACQKKNGKSGKLTE